MLTQIALIVGGALIGWGVNWQTGLGSYILAYAVVWQTAQNIIVAVNALARHR